MAATTSQPSGRQEAVGDLTETPKFRGYLWGVSGFVVIGLGAWLWVEREIVVSHWRVLPVWLAACLVADALFVRSRRAVTLSMSLAITFAAALVLPPAVACVVAFVGFLDPREFTGSTTLARGVFNRAQVAAATFVAAFIVSVSATDVGSLELYLPWAIAALVADVGVNLLLVVMAVSIRDDLPAGAALSLIVGNRPLRTVLLCLSLGMLSVLTAAAYPHIGWLALSACLVPLAFARWALRDSQALEEMERHVLAKGEAVRRSVDAADAERRDERLALAGELHDEVLPALFKVHLLGQVIRQDLDSGRLLDLDKDVPELLEAIELAQGSLRRALSDLRGSTLGPNGLASALSSVAARLETAGAPRLTLDVAGVDCSGRPQLVAYQVLREAMSNAAKYSRAESVRVAVWREDGLLRATVVDDGVGFEPASVDEAAHFGLQFMRERVASIGGSLIVDSRLGIGTAVLVSVPLEDG